MRTPMGRGHGGAIPGRGRGGPPVMKGGFPHQKPAGPGPAPARSPVNQGSDAKAEELPQQPDASADASKIVLEFSDSVLDKTEDKSQLNIPPTNESNTSVISESQSELSSAAEKTCVISASLDDTIDSNN